MKKSVKKYSNADFAKRFRTLMGKSELTLAEISQITGRAISTVSTWRRGRLPRKASDIDALARTFDVSAHYLLYGGHASAEIFSNSRPALTDGGKRQLRYEVTAHFYTLVDRAEKIDGGLERLAIQMRKIAI